MAADPRPTHFNWRPGVSRAFLGPGWAALSRSRRGCGRPTWPAAPTCARGSTRTAPAGASVLPGRSHSHPAHPREPGGRQGGRLTVLGPGQRPPPLGQGGFLGGGAGRAAARRLDKKTLDLLPQLRVVVGGDRAMLLVLLSLAAICRSALPREPVSIPLRRGRPFLRFPSF